MSFNVFFGIDIVACCCDVASFICVDVDVDGVFAVVPSELNDIKFCVDEDEVLARLFVEEANEFVDEITSWGGSDFNTNFFVVLLLLCIITCWTLPIGFKPNGDCCS